jgi:hypothetical protein
MTEQIVNATKRHTVSTLEAIPLTLKLIWSELRWSVVRFLRSVEIKQLEKRLAREYQKLGRLSASEAKDAEQAELCRKQIAFLDKELSFLHQELSDLRQDLIVKRCRKWGLEQAEDQHAEPAS